MLMFLLDHKVTWHQVYFLPGQFMGWGVLERHFVMAWPTKSTKFTHVYSQCVWHKCFARHCIAKWWKKSCKQNHYYCCKTSEFVLLLLVNLINKFQIGITSLFWNKAIWLDVTSHVISFIQSECINIDIIKCQIRITTLLWNKAFWLDLTRECII